MKQHIISTKRLRLYKAVVYLLSILVAFAFFYFSFHRYLKEEYFGAVFYALEGLFLFIFFYLRTSKLQSIAYDQENLYVQQKNQELIIPFTEIKKIKLTSLTGVHNIYLYSDLGLGKEILFKSSLWYPFNYNKVDDQVYELQKLIDNAKATYKPENFNALGS